MGDLSATRESLRSDALSEGRRSCVFAFRAVSSVQRRERALTLRPKIEADADFRRDARPRAGLRLRLDQHQRVYDPAATERQRDLHAERRPSRAGDADSERARRLTHRVEHAGRDAGTRSWNGSEQR